MEDGDYVPYKDDVFFELIMWVKIRVHPWIRLNRVIRDIPNEYIYAGNSVTNLRQKLQSELKKRNQYCKCIRCREVKGNKVDHSTVDLKIRKYQRSGGMKNFLSMDTSDQMHPKLLGFLRLRINGDDPDIVFDELIGCSLIRELHVYGKMKPVGSKNDGVQHYGYGKRLLDKAEQITKGIGLKKISVISGVGVREYYRKHGYHDVEGEGEFLIKELS